MKTLEFNQMEEVQGGGFLSGFTCMATICVLASVIAGTAGTAVIAAGYVFAAGCGGLLGLGMASGNFY